LTVHDSSFPFAQCTGREVSEPFGFNARFDISNACLKSEDILDEVNKPDNTLLEGSRDVFVHKDFPSLDFNNIVSPNPLDHSHFSPMCLQPSPSPDYYIGPPIENPMIFDASVDLGYEVNMFNMFGWNANNCVSLGCFSGFNASLDPYYMYLEDLPRKITWTTFFNHPYNFSKAIDKVKRILNVFGMILVTNSYHLFSELWSQELDKLLHALTASDLTSRVLTT